MPLSASRKFARIRTNRHRGCNGVPMADTEGRHQRIGVSGMNQEMVETGAVFVQTNEEHNRVLAFTRKADGSIAESTAHETGGRGSMAPHLPSQGSVVLSGDRRFLLVANPGSGDVTAFRVDGARLELIGTVPSGGDAPRSIAERDGRVFVMNTGRPGIASFRMSDMGLAPTVDGEMPLAAADADPAQIGFTPDGRTLIVTQRGTDAIAAYPVRDDGTLGEPSTVMSSGPTPYGFAFTTNGTLIMTEASRAPEGCSRRVVLRHGRGRPRAEDALARQRHERDLLGGRDAGRPLRLHDELRREHRVAVRNRVGRLDQARGRGGGIGRPRSSGPSGRRRHR